LETLRQLEALRRDMVAARTRLAVLMNVHPESDFTIADAEGPAPTEAIRIRFEPEALELAALRNRSEVRTAAYQQRINREEARVALLRMLPGIDLSSGVNYTSDSFKANQRWFDASMALTWNVLNLISGPANIELAETQEELSRIRRLALSMAVIAQVNVSQLRYGSAIRDFALANEIAEVETEIQRQITQARAANSASPQDVIEADVRAALASFRRDQAYAEMQSAYGRLIAAAGADPQIEPSEEGGIMVLAGSIGKALQKWEQGEFVAPARWAGEDDAD
jgi:multidrug efflux system outer membrane protein